MTRCSIYGGAFYVCTVAALGMEWFGTALGFCIITVCFWITDAIAEVLK